MDALVLVAALTLVRIATFVYFLPLLGGPNVPRLVKIGLALALTVLLFDDALAAAGPNGLLSTGSVTWLSFALAVVREMLLGGIIGFALSLFLVPAKLAGDFIAQESGLTFANVVTATGDGSSSPFATLFEMLASLTFFALDLHHVFLLLLQETFRHMPIGTPFRLPNWDLLTAVSVAQESGLVLAAPVALCLFLTTVVLALMTRAAPQLNVYSVGFPLRVLVSLGAVFLLLPQIMAGIVGLFAQFLQLLHLQG